MSAPQHLCREGTTCKVIILWQAYPRRTSSITNILFNGKEVSYKPTPAVSWDRQRPSSAPNPSLKSAAEGGPTLSWVTEKLIRHSNWKTRHQPPPYQSKTNPLLSTVICSIISRSREEFQILSSCRIFRSNKPTIQLMDRGIRMPRVTSSKKKMMPRRLCRSSGLVLKLSTLSWNVSSTQETRVTIS